MRCYIRIFCLYFTTNNLFSSKMRIILLDPKLCRIVCISYIAKMRCTQDFIVECRFRREFAQIQYGLYNYDSFQRSIRWSQKNISMLLSSTATSITTAVKNSRIPMQFQYHIVSSLCHSVLHCINDTLHGIAYDYSYNVKCGLTYCIRRLSAGDAYNNWCFDNCLYLHVLSDSSITIHIIK